MHDCDPRHFCLYEGLNLQPSKMPKSVVFREGGSVGGGGVLLLTQGTHFLACISFLNSKLCHI